MGDKARMFYQTEKIDLLLLALSKAIVKIPAIEKHGKNTFFKKADGKPSTYALLDDILVVIKPILAESNLTLLQFPITNANGWIGVRSIIAHSSGQYMASDLFLNPKDHGAHEAGKIITYLKRYMAGSILGISTEEDDDGNSVSPGTADKKPDQNTNAQTNKPITPNPAKAGEVISEAQAKRLFAISRGKGWTNEELKGYLAKHYGITTTKDIKRGDYEAVCNAMEETYSELMKDNNSDKAVNLDEIPF